MKLATLFSDHAVFQRNKPVPVWGWTKPFTSVSASLGSVSAQTLSTKDGHFLLRLPALPAGGPYELTVTAGDEKITVYDILIGEVWVASGQSNMQWNMSQSHDAEFVNSISNNRLRMITAPNVARVGKQCDIGASWRMATPENASLFSAVGYHFADKLQERLNIPVGIISTSWGGTFVEAWTSREALVRNPATQAWTERYEATLFSPDFWERTERDPKTHFPVDPGNDALARGWADPGFSDQEWNEMDIPRTWQCGGHDISGVFWFRLAVDLPADWAGQDLELNLGAVDKSDITYFNGEQIGATGSGLDDTVWNVPRTYTVPGKQVQAGRNVIAVRAYSFIYGGGLIGPASKMSLSKINASDPAIPLAGNWRYNIEHDFGLIQPPVLPMGPNNPNSPYILYDNMIHPLLPYAISGAIWYQGESNAGNAGQYRDMLTTMIRDWRRAWGQGDFPFIIVQLANYMKAETYQADSSWARLREAQVQALSEPETGLAVTIDIGEAIDIHPTNKRDVGHRLAQWALTRYLGERGTPGGPLYRAMNIEDHQVRLTFDYTGEGLASHDGEPLTHFVIAGLDKCFQPAQAVIDGETIVVSSPDVAEPVAVRYAWADNPEGCNLFNKDGYPASPFRTDCW